MTKWILAVTAAIAATLLLQHSLTAPDQLTPAGSGGGAVIAAASTDNKREPAPPDTTRREAVASASPEPVAAPAADALRGRVVATDGTAVPGLTLAHERPGRPQLRGSWLHVGDTSMDLDQPGLRESLAHPQGRAMFAQDFGPAAADVLALLSGEPLERPLATTDTFGRFAFPNAIDTAQVVVVQPGLMLYGTGYLPDDDELLLVVGPAVAVTGRVHDEQGTPIADAYVSLGYRIDALPGFAARLRNASGYRSWNARSDASGKFDLGTVPAQPMVTINVQQRGYHAANFVTAELTGPIDCMLRKAPAHQRPRVAGIVRLADGQPAAGARVDFGQDGAVCGADGRFAFEATAGFKHAPLTAWLPDLQPSIVPDLGRRLQEDPRAGEELELRLGTTALRITGVVLDADGKPLANAYVFAVGSTLIGSSDQVLEHHIGGQDRVHSDAAGRFELRGLSARDYVVRAVEPRQLLVIDSPPVAAGSTGVELRQPDAAFFDRLEGVVVDRFGQPVHGAEVWLSTTLLKGPSMSKTMRRNDGVVTDQGGRFVVERCPRRGVQLACGGDGLQMTKVEVPTEGQPLRVQVTRRLRFQLTALGGVRATAFEVRDVGGVVLFTTELRPNVESIHRRVPIRGEPPTYVVDDLAAQIVFFDGDRELLTQPLVLRAQDVVEIAY